MIKYLPLLFLLLYPTVDAQILSPRDLLNPTAWYDATDPRTMFDATSGGSLVAIGSGVARLEDKSGNGHHATQSSAGSRPIRATAPTSGVRNLINHSQNISQWSSINSTIVSNVETNPNGNIPADRVTPNATSSNRVEIDISDIKVGVSYRFAVWMKQGSQYGTNTRVAITGPGGSPAILDTNVILTSSWVQYIFSSGTGHGQTGFRFRIYPSNAGFTVGDNIIIGGVQLDEGVTTTAYQHRVTQHEVYEEGFLNRNYLFFDGSNDFLDAASLSTMFQGDDTPHSSYVVARPNIGGVSGVVWSFGTSSTGNHRGEFRYNQGTSTMLVWRRDTSDLSVLSTGTFRNNVLRPQLSSFVFPGTSVDLFLNNNTIGSGALDTGSMGTNPNRFVIGGRGYSSTDLYYRGDLHGIVIYNSANSSDSRTTISSRLFDYYFRRNKTRQFQNEFN